MHSEEIDDFVRKSTIVQETIKGIANGTIDEKTVDLREYGILTSEQQKEENERRAQARKKFELKKAEKKKREQEREKKQWWAGAKGIYGKNNQERNDKVHDDTPVEVRKFALGFVRPLSLPT